MKYDSCCFFSNHKACNTTTQTNLTRQKQVSIPSVLPNWQLQQPPLACLQVLPKTEHYSSVFIIIFYDVTFPLYII